MNIKNIVTNFFGKDNIEEQKEIAINKYSKDIDTIIYIFKNLGLLDKNNILNNAKDEEKEAVKKILGALDLSYDDNEINFLKELNLENNFGYGDEFLEKIRNDLYSVVRENYNKSSDEVNSLLIKKANIYLNNYKSYLSDLAESLKYIKDSHLNSENDLLKLKDFLFTKIKNEKLGYSIDLGSKIKEMTDNLMNLDYGGYGKNVIDKFVMDANKVISDGKNQGKRSIELYNYIKDNLYGSLKNQYKVDLNFLKKRIDFLNSKKDINSEEKEYRKQELILDFNIHHGHVINPEETLNKFVDKFSKEFSKNSQEYGSNFLEKFKSEAENILNTTYEQNVDNNNIVKTIKIILLYNRYQDKYFNEEKQLDEYISNIDNSTLPDYIKNKQIVGLKAYWQRKMTCNDSFDTRLKYMIDTLKELKWNKEEIDDFEKDALSKLENCDTDTEKLKLLDKLYIDLLTDTREKLDTYIEIMTMSLASLPNGGYGFDALNEFKTLATKITTDFNNFDDKKRVLTNQYNYYKKEYLHNLDVLKEWINERLREYKGADKDDYHEKLSAEAKKMLSLSPTMFAEYIAADSNKKKKEYEDYNLNVILNYLAENELKLTKDKDLYKERLSAIENGEIPYDDTEIDNARDKLYQAVFEDNTQKKRRLKTVEGFIDGTLFTQLTKAEESISKKR